MAKRNPGTEEQELPDLCGRQAARLPAQWAGIDPAELEAAHDRARCLSAGGYGQLRWDRSHGEP
jgi:hypothetical protein